MKFRELIDSFEGDRTSYLSKMNVILLAPPAYFPIGLREFFEVYPQARIQIYHPDYADLSKFFFGGLIKDLLSEWPQIEVFPTGKHPEHTCDLYLEVAEVPLSHEEEKRLPIDVWPQSKGSLDLREFIHPRKEQPERTIVRSPSQMMAWLAKHSPPEEPLAAFVKDPKILNPDDCWAQLYLLIDVVHFLIGRDELRLERQALLGMKEVPEVYEWYQKFCRLNGIEDDLVTLDRLLGLRERWPRIRAALSGRRERIPQIPFFKTLKVERDLDDATHNLIVRALKEVTGTLSGHIDTLSPEIKEALGIRTTPEILDWYLRFCNVNGIRENFVSAYVHLSGDGTLWKFLSSMRS